MEFLERPALRGKEARPARPARPAFGIVAFCSL